VAPLCGLLLESSEPSTRRAAAWSLGEIRDPAAVEALVLATGDPDYDVRTEAGGAFDKFGNVGVALALTAMSPAALPSGEVAGLDAGGAVEEGDAPDDIPADIETGDEVQPEGGQPTAITPTVDLPEDAGDQPTSASPTVSPDDQPTSTSPTVGPPGSDAPPPRAAARPAQPAKPSQSAIPALRRLLRRRAGS
jgi:HEAT repeat protein